MLSFEIFNKINVIFMTININHNNCQKNFEFFKFLLNAAYFQSDSTFDLE